MRHPAMERIKKYALGSSDWTERTLMEAHLFFCPECEEKIKVFRNEEYGNFIIDNALPPDYSNQWFLDTVEKLENPSNPMSIKKNTELSYLEKVIPSSVLVDLPLIEKWNWKTMWPTKGRIAAIKEDAYTGISLYCAEFKAGETAPIHKHLVQEDTVMLQGGYIYGDNKVRVGDWDSVSPNTEHAPKVDTDEDCICLVRIQTQKSYRFKGLSLWRQPFVSLSSWFTST